MSIENNNVNFSPKKVASELNLLPSKGADLARTYQQIFHCKNVKELPIALKTFWKDVDRNQGFSLNDQELKQVIDGLNKLERNFHKISLNAKPWYKRFAFHISNLFHGSYAAKRVQKESVRIKEVSQVRQNFQQVQFSRMAEKARVNLKADRENIEKNKPIFELLNNATFDQKAKQFYTKFSNTQFANDNDRVDFLERHLKNIKSSLGDTLEIDMVIALLLCGKNSANAVNFISWLEGASSLLLNSKHLPEGSEELDSIAFATVAEAYNVLKEVSSK